MKKILLIIALIIPMVSFAQTKKKTLAKKPSVTAKAKVSQKEHLNFMGYPLSGSIDDFTNKLINEKGCTLDKTFDNGNLVILKGNFWKFTNCEIRLFGDNKIINSAQVTTSYAYIDDKKDVIEKYTEKYGQPHISANSDCYIWEIPSGKLQINDNSYVPFMFIFYDYSINDAKRAMEKKFDNDL